MYVAQFSTYCLSQKIASTGLISKQVQELCLCQKCPFASFKFKMHEICSAFTCCLIVYWIILELKKRNSTFSLAPGAERKSSSSSRSDSNQNSPTWQAELDCTSVALFIYFLFILLIYLQFYLNYQQKDPIGFLSNAFMIDILV